MNDQYCKSREDAEEWLKTEGHYLQDGVNTYWFDHWYCCSGCCGDDDEPLDEVLDHIEVMNNNWDGVKKGEI